MRKIFMNNSEKIRRSTVVATNGSRKTTYDYLTMTVKESTPHGEIYIDYPVTYRIIDGEHYDLDDETGKKSHREWVSDLILQKQREINRLNNELNNVKICNERLEEYYKKL